MKTAYIIDEIMSFPADCLLPVPPSTLVGLGWMKRS